MAETADDLPEFLLLCDALGLVMKRGRLSEAAALDLMYEFTGNHRIELDWWQSPYGSKDAPPPRASPLILRPDPIADAKWGIYWVTDWANNTVTYLRDLPDPPEPGLEVLRRLSKHGLPDEPYFRFLVVRMKRDDIYTMLREVGLVATPDPPATPEAASTSSSALPIPTGGTELWVYNTMKATSPRTSDLRGQYVDNLEERCPFEGVKRKTLANYYYKYRKQFERP